MRKYYVVDVREHEEWVDLMTDDKAEAIDFARDMWERMHPYDRKHSKIEIRTYLEDIEDEACDCFDYNLTAWQIWICARGTGDKFERCATISEAERKIQQYEEDDIADGTYFKNFYDIVNEDGESIGGIA